MSTEYRYKVGGSLGFQEPSYVTRMADGELFNALKAGEFCYVLNSRQMGKSSLRVRTMQLLKAENIACAAIDMTRIGSKDVTAAQWYKGLTSELERGFRLLGKIDKDWWKQQEGLSSVQRLSRFIEDILLVKVTADKIIIFFDEIDSILSLNFEIDDFFALIRFCYNQRGENPEYNRISFALFGVATPSDLIRDKTRTLFNIGRGIELTGFTALEAQPLIIGLEGKVDNPDAVLKEILYWTGGQPFLTQKLCYLVINSGMRIGAESEREAVEKLVRSQFIENWESQDEPVHFRTIRDRISATVSNRVIATVSNRISATVDNRVSARAYSQSRELAVGAKHLDDKLQRQTDISSPYPSPCESLEDNLQPQTDIFSPYPSPCESLEDNLQPQTDIFSPYPSPCESLEDNLQRQINVLSPYPSPCNGLTTDTNITNPVSATLANPILHNQQKAAGLLLLYQQILQEGEIPTDDTANQRELCLSGLVVRHHSKLKVYNPIYKAVFNLEWVNGQLAELRPYHYAIKSSS